MKKEDFINIIKLHQEQNARVDRASEFIDYGSPIIDFGFMMFDYVLREAFNENQIDWIFWWLYDRIDSNGREHPYWDENGDEHYLHTIDDLWDYINKVE